MPALRSYLQLVRLPAVFTALADIFLGWLLTHGALEPLTGFLLLLISSACLYLSGMVFNDVFDRRIDAEQRPTRPIPSGRIMARTATQFGAVLMLAGLIAALAVGWQSLTVATALAACILAYDGLLKGTPLGPLAMGGCRFLNVMLGASGLIAWERLWGVPQVWIAGGLGLYIVGVTWFARQEAVRSSRGQLAAAQGVVNLGLAALIAAVLAPERLAILRHEDRYNTLFALLVVVVIVNRRMARALFDPAPGKVQPAVRVMLLSLIVLDATLIFFVTGNVPIAVLVATLLLPAMFLGRWIYMT